MNDPQTRFPYEDPTLDVDRRVDDLLARMELADKAGVMFQPLASIGALDLPGMLGSLSMRELLQRRINHVNILQSATARELAEWHNAIQRAAQQSPLGIPITLSSDPRHSFTNNPAASLLSGPFTQWPETLGLGALDDPELVERYADTVRREYLATGIRLALHPQVDIATDPRWARAQSTFGSDAGVAGRLGAAYVRGLQGPVVGPDSVSAMVKHFPGGGAQLDGEDPHFAYGREQVYPGGKFDLHLQPFREAFAAGASQVMPYYGMPVGTEYEEVGFSFNKQIVTGLLRETLGFDGIVCTDWGVLSTTCWGVEDLTYEERMLKALDAGVDQFGGEHRPEVLIGLVSRGEVPEARLDVSVRRLLREKFLLGLFDERRFVDADAADQLVGGAEDRAVALEAQTAAQILLKNAPGAAQLPLSGQPKVYLEGAALEAFAGWAHVVRSPEDADVAIVRTVAPWEERGKPGETQYFFHAGSLDFHDDEIAHLRDIASKAPLVLDVYLDRPAILGPVAEIASVVIVNFGASDEALTRIVFGAAQPQGRLPFEIPSSMEAVAASRPDVPNDTQAPTYEFGFGLSFPDWSPATRPDPGSTTVDVVVSPYRFDLRSTPLGVVLDDPDGREVIDEHLPDLGSNPMIEIIKSMPLAAVLDMAGEHMPSQALAAVRERLATLPAR